VAIMCYKGALADISKHTDFQEESLRTEDVIRPQRMFFRWHVFTAAETWVWLELSVIDVPLRVLHFLQNTSSAEAMLVSDATKLRAPGLVQKDDTHLQKR
jgi:hypothetical protein